MHKLMETIILDTDSYKFSHWKQYPEGTDQIWSYIEPRIRGVDVVSFGLQPFLRDYLSTPLTENDVEVAKTIVEAHGCPFNYEGWMHIVKKHGGYLPLKIEALPDGTVFRSQNCQLQITNTDPKCFWLVSYVETALVRAIWYGSTVATISRNVKLELKHYWELTSEEPIESLDFKLHDFGSRGASSRETAKLGGLAHLVNFLGTDTAIALVGAIEYYDADTAVGYSIPASEHSTITSWGQEHEVDAYRNMIKQYGGQGKIYACVSDSYNFINAVDKIWGVELKDEILKKGGTLVVRPDSGDPVHLVMMALKSLGNSFGYNINSKGCKVLHPAVRVIQGDGLEPATITKILQRMYEEKWSIDNVAFGMGGGLLQKVNRDTFSYAQKACAISINGEVHDVFKKPITDIGKHSKSGILSTHVDEAGWFTDNNRENNAMVTYFLDGSILNNDSWNQVKERAKV